MLIVGGLNPARTNLLHLWIMIIYLQHWWAQRIDVNTVLNSLSFIILFTHSFDYSLIPSFLHSCIHNVTYQSIHMISDTFLSLLTRCIDVVQPMHPPSPSTQSIGPCRCLEASERPVAVSLPARRAPRLKTYRSLHPRTTETRGPARCRLTGPRPFVCQPRQRRATSPVLLVVKVSVYWAHSYQSSVTGSKGKCGYYFSI